MKTAVTAASVLLALTGCGEVQTSNLQDGVDTVHVAPSFSIGVLAGDSNYVFGTIADAVALEDGTIAVLDEGSRNARLYTSEGEFIARFAREGSGPGELLSPGGMVRLSDGSILILDHAAGTHRYSQQGDYLELRTDFMGGDVPQWAWGTDQMGFVGAITRMEPVDDALMVSFIIGRWDDSPEPSVEYFRNTFPFNPARMDEFFSNSFFSATFAAGPDGITCVAPVSSESYVIDLFAPDGTLINSIVRDLEQVAKSAEELEEETQLITSILRERGIPPENIRYEPDPCRWMIQPQGLGIDGNGRIWARNGLTDRIVMDVYSPEGDHIAAVVFNDVSTGGTSDFLNIKVQDDRLLIYSLQDPDYPRLHVVEMPELP